MHALNEVNSVYEFINNTAEGNLRKMLVNDQMTDAYFRVFLKIGKLYTQADFVEAFTGETIPRMKLSPKEREIKETFWPICKKRLEDLGFLNMSQAA